MTKDEALKMAIEALEMHVPYYEKDRGCHAIQACKEALETPECNTHPKAPHGFNRNASHSAGRYVCECEGWELEWQGLSDDDFKDTSWFTDEFIEGANWAQNKLKEKNNAM
jgi:hypothetical protein